MYASALEKQIARVESCYEHCYKEVAVPLFDTIVVFQLDRIRRAFAGAIEKLNIYRLERTCYNHHLAFTATEKLRERINLAMDFRSRCGIFFKDKHDIKIGKISTAAERLFLQVNSPQHSPVYMLKELDFAIERKNLSLEQSKGLEEKMMKNFNSLSQTVKDEIEESFKRLIAEDPDHSQRLKQRPFDNLRLC